jgi:thiol-disulfide isomerase/thioredoxin
MSQRPPLTARATRAGWLLAGSLLLLVGLSCTKSKEGPITAASGAYQVADEEAKQTTASGSKSAPGSFATSVGDAASTGKAPAAQRLSDTPPGAAPSGTARVVAGPEGDFEAAGPAQVRVGDMPQPPATPPFQPNAAGDPYAVPDGKEALIAFLQRLQQREPQGTNQPQMLEDFRRIQGARIRAAEKLTEVAKDKETRVNAARAKVDALRALAQTGSPETVKELQSYCRVLVKDRDPELVGLGRLMLFALAVDDMAAGKETDVQSILTELKALVTSGAKDPGVFVVTSQAAMVLQQMGQKEPAMEACRLVGTTYQASDNPQIAAQARDLLIQVKVFELGLHEKVNAMLSGQPNSTPPVVEALQTLLAAPDPGLALLNMTSQVAQMIEAVGQYAAAAQTYAAIEAAFQDHPDKGLAAEAAKRAANGRLRVGLVGKPLAVQGVLLDGTPFDWGKYQGKLVLIDFWATWCQPCLQEIPNIERNYARYHDKGFEVVGVNLDDDPKNVERFLEVQPLPWTTAFSADPAARGFNHPLAVQCGVDAIPFVVLVDRDGKVKALHVRGEQLDRQLEAIFGPAAPAAKPTAAQPATGQPKQRSGAARQ